VASLWLQKWLTTARKIASKRSDYCLFLTLIAEIIREKRLYYFMMKYNLTCRVAENGY